MFMRGQASLEYMIMLALSLVVFSTILYVTGTLISTSSVQVGVDASARAVNKMREAADFIFIHGHPSRTKINVYIPPSIEEIAILGSNNSIRARVSIGHTYTDIYQVTKGNIQGDLSPIVREGYWVIRVESSSDNTVNMTVL